MHITGCFECEASMATLQEADLKRHHKWRLNCTSAVGNVARSYSLFHKLFFTLFFFFFFLEPAHKTAWCLWAVFCQIQRHLDVFGLTLLAFPPPPRLGILWFTSAWSRAWLKTLRKFLWLKIGRWSAHIQNHCWFCKIKNRADASWCVVLLLRVTQIYVASSWFPSRCL